MTNPTPDQPTGMNELREILEPWRSFIHSEYNGTSQLENQLYIVDIAEAAIQQIVKRCLPSSDIVSINAIRHNLQQAGLLRGEDV